MRIYREISKYFRCSYFTIEDIYDEISS